MNEMVRITSRDTVAVALKPLKAGETVSFGEGGEQTRGEENGFNDLAILTHTEGRYNPAVKPTLNPVKEMAC